LSEALTNPQTQAGKSQGFTLSEALTIINENVFAATVKDIFNSVRGLEMVVDTGLDLSIISIAKIHNSLNIQIGDEIFVYIPESAISIIEQ